VWTERPARRWPVAIHGPQFSGEAEPDKLRRIRLESKGSSVDALVLSDSHAVAWTCQIRGADVSHTPLPCPMRWWPKDGRPTVFIDHRKLSNSARDHLEQTADVEEAGRTDAKLTSWRSRRIDCARQAKPPTPDRLIVTSGGKPVRGNDPVACSRPSRTRPKSKAPHGAISAYCGGAWRDSSPGSTARAPTGALTRDRHRRGAGNIPPRHRPREGLSVPTIAGTGAERAIVTTRYPQDQTGGFRQAICC